MKDARKDRNVTSSAASSRSVTYLRANRNTWLPLHNPARRGKRLPDLRAFFWIRATRSESSPCAGAPRVGSCATRTDGIVNYPELIEFDGQDFAVFVVTLRNRTLRRTPRRSTGELRAVAANLSRTRRSEHFFRRKSLHRPGTHTCDGEVGCGGHSPTQTSRLSHPRSLALGSPDP